MVTLTIPEQLRGLFYRHQHRTYTLLFEAAVEALKQLGLDNRHMGGELGMTAVLHTHTRRLEYHPHLHVVIPAACIADKSKSFYRKDGRYFIRGDVIARLFRGKLIYRLYEEGFAVPKDLPTDWVTHVRHIGKGLPALQYLSRYLYRGVLSEKAIVKTDSTHVTFRYQDAETRKMTTRSLNGEDFIWKLLTHVLPRRFRRVRDFGFLHHNAKKKLTFIQYFLGVKSYPIIRPPKSPFVVSSAHRQPRSSPSSQK